MKMNNFAKAVIVLAIIGIVGFAATSFAGWGRGGGGYCWGQGGGWAQRGNEPGDADPEHVRLLNDQRGEHHREIRNDAGEADRAAGVDVLDRRADCSEDRADEQVTEDEVERVGDPVHQRQ